MDKVLIAEESFGEFMNFIMPGSYKSITRVDFHALDKASISPLGLYGSSNEILEYLKRVGAIPEES